MNLTEWRNRSQQFTLPSGLEVSLRRVSLLDLATKGTIPQNLMAPVEKAARRKGNENFSMEDLREFSGVATFVAQACIIEPEGLLASELEWNDVQAIYAWANEVAGKLEPFRTK